MSTLHSRNYWVLLRKLFLIKFLLYSNPFLWLFAGNFLNLFRFRLHSINLPAIKFQNWACNQKPSENHLRPRSLACCDFSDLRYNVKIISFSFVAFRAYVQPMPGRLFCIANAGSKCIFHLRNGHFLRQCCMPTGHCSISYVRRLGLVLRICCCRDSTWL